jgi:predicted RecA/RadA family phage recombinase
VVNQKYDGKLIDVQFAVVTAPGDLVPVGDLVGVAVVGGAIGVTGAVQLTGVFEVPKAIGQGSGFDQGVKLYYDPAAKDLTENAGNLKFSGHAFKSSADVDTTCWVRLIG